MVIGMDLFVGYPSSINRLLTICLVLYSVFLVLPWRFVNCTHMRRCIQVLNALSRIESSCNSSAVKILLVVKKTSYSSA